MTLLVVGRLPGVAAAGSEGGIAQGEGRLPEELDAYRSVELPGMYRISSTNSRLSRRRRVVGSRRRVVGSRRHVVGSRRHVVGSHRRCAPGALSALPADSIGRAPDPSPSGKQSVRVDRGRLAVRRLGDERLP